MELRGRSLRSYLIVQVGLPVILILGIVVALGLSVVSFYTEERLQRNLRILAQAISLPVSEALEQNNTQQIEASLASVFDISEVYSAYLFNQDGDRIASFGNVRPSQSQSDEALRQTEDGEFAQYESIDGRSVYSYFLPLFQSSGQPNGLLQITRRRSDIEQELNQLRIWSWAGFGLVSLLVLSTIGLAHQRSIGRPIKRLLGSMERVERGDREHRAATEGPDEIKRLAVGLNDILDAIDLAERKVNHQREEREIMAERLRQTETLAALGQLSAGVAHELGAPLSVVNGRAQRLERRASDDEEKRELSAIRDQAQRMTAIVEQLLSFGRRSQAEHQRLDLGQWMADVLTRFRDEFPEADVYLTTGPAATIQGDALSLEQAVINLLRNAAQSSRGSRIDLGWYSQEGSMANGLVLFVRDRGPGIPEAIETELFKPFFSTKQPGEGSGLGLAIVKRVMREHLGEVRVRNMKPGVRFELYFPASVISGGNTYE